MRENVMELVSWKVEGKRYPLEEGRRFKVKGRKGIFKVVRLDAWPGGYVEVLCWWVSSATALHPSAQWVTLALTGDNAREVSKVYKD